jgi:hypothetical protein
MTVQANGFFFSFNFSMSYLNKANGHSKCTYTYPCSSMVKKILYVQEQIKWWNIIVFVNVFWMVYFYFWFEKMFWYNINVKAFVKTQWVFCVWVVFFHKGENKSFNNQNQGFLHEWKNYINATLHTRFILVNVACFKWFLKKEIT